ncbi:MAG: DNA (cytosine-5-)-methyltransferase [Candidatus Jordarchaeaceae archaeon]
MKKASSHKFKILSLFSGAGGMDLGFEMIDKFQLLFANDILLSSAQTYSLNFHLDIIDMKKNSSFSLNGNPVYLVGDVSNLDFENLECEDVDLIIGGPPCQDFSVVRGPEKERQGIAVYRGRLYAHFIRALIRVQPKVFVFENVPGLLSANRGNAFRVILEDFSKLNFRWNEIKNIVGNNFNKNIRNYKYSEPPENANIHEKIMADPLLNVFDFWWLYVYFIKGNYYGFVAAFILFACAIVAARRLWKLLNSLITSGL